MSILISALTMAHMRTAIIYFISQQCATVINICLLVLSVLAADKCKCLTSSNEIKFIDDLVQCLSRICKTECNLFALISLWVEQQTVPRNKLSRRRRCLCAYVNTKGRRMTCSIQRACRQNVKACLLVVDTHWIHHKYWNANIYVIWFSEPSSDYNSSAMCDCFFASFCSF